MLKLPYRKDVLIRKLNELNDLLNDFLIIAKWPTWTNRKRSLGPNSTVFFKEMINI